MKKIISGIVIIIAAVFVKASAYASDLPFEALSGSNVTPMPQPGILLILGSGLMGVALYRRMRNK